MYAESDRGFLFRWVFQVFYGWLGVPRKEAGWAHGGAQLAAELGWHTSVWDGHVSQETFQNKMTFQHPVKILWSHLKPFNCSLKTESEVTVLSSYPHTLDWKSLLLKEKKKWHESGLNSHSSHMMSYTTVALMADLSKENGLALKPNCEGDNAFYCLV